MDVDTIIDMSHGVELNKLVAEVVFGYRCYSVDEESIIEGQYVTINYCEMKWDDGEVYEALLPNYSDSISDAWDVAEKAGICIIPQSSENGFRWYAMDVHSVSYRGSEIAIKELNDSGISAEFAPEAIAKAAVISKLGEVKDI